MPESEKNSANAAATVPATAALLALGRPLTREALIEGGTAATVTEVAALVGVSADQIERLQGETCQPGEDFADNGETSLIHASGIKKILARLDEEMLAGRVADPAAPPPEVPAPVLSREDLRIARVFRWSNNLLATRDNGLEVVVTVRSNRHLAAGMVLRDCVQGVMGWVYEGRLPRSVGERQLFQPAPPAVEPRRPRKGRQS